MRAIIAGGGELPRYFAHYLQTKYQEAPFILGIQGNWRKSDFTDFAHDEIPIGNLQTGVEILKSNQCDELIFVGKVTRTDAHQMQKDTVTQQIYEQIQNQGDDYAVRAIQQMLQEQGFRITPPQELCQDLLLNGSGALGTVTPNEIEMQAITYGQKILHDISSADIGQSIVTQQGLILGVEAIEGTDALIARTAEWQIGGKGAVLTKLPKLGQTHLMDFPVIGLETISHAIANQFAGIAVQNRNILFVSQQESLTLANENGFFIYALEERCA